MTQLHITVSAAKAAAKTSGLLTTGMVGIPVTFTFSAQWAGLHIIPVFRCGNLTRDGVLTDGSTTVPHELLNTPGEHLYIGAEGRNADGTVVIPTLWADAGVVLPGACVTGEPALEPTPDRYDGILSRLEALEQKPEPEPVAQSDWNAPEGEPGHVLNRTHWTERKLTELLPETKLTYNENVGNMVLPEEFPFQVKQTYTVFYNGTPYTCTCYELEMQGVHLVGVGNGKDFGLPDTGEPFCMGNVSMMPGMTMVVDYTGATDCTVSVASEEERVHQLDSRYIKDMYSETRQPGSITFDGDITDRYIASNIFGYKMVKVSDDILTAQQLQNATITMVDVTAGITLTKTVAQWAAEANMTLEEYVTTDEATGIITLHSGLVVVSPGHYTDINVAWQPGTYFLYVKLSELGTTTHAYTSELTYEDAKVTQIHPKYIPQMYYEETAGLVQLLPETSPAYNESEGMFDLTGLPALEADRTYAVTYNGTEYTCRSYLYQGLTFLGSRMIQTGAPDAYPFVIASGTMDGVQYSRLADINGATECTVAIAAESTLIHKIPAKYMPDLPYFDLTAMGLPRFNWSGSTVSADADCSAIIAALEKGPVKLRWQTAINGKLWEFAGVVTGVKNSVHGSYNATFLTVLEEEALGGTTPIVHNFHFTPTTMTGQLVPLTLKALT